MTKETQTDQINLPEDERETVKLLVRYLYEGEYDPVLPNLTYSGMATWNTPYSKTKPF